MKKSIAIVIVGVFLVSVLAVGIFGSAIFANPDQIITKVETVAFLHDNVVSVQLVDGRATFQLVWVVTPDNATEQSLDFIEDYDFVTVSETGLVTFTGSGFVRIIGRSQDGTNKTAEQAFFVKG